MEALESVPRSRWRIILGLVCLTAAALAARLIFPGRSPMGLHIDEASNAWNAWCILHTLRDEHGQQLPFFYTEAFGDFRSPLYLYFLIPFQAIFGLSEFTTRLPAVFAGTACVPLICYVGRKLFSVPVGLLAAGLIALDPWHLQQSRWGHEATITPFLVLGSLAMLLWAGAPVADEPSRPRPLRGLLAGAAAGFACYGYAAIRIYLPILLLATLLLTWRQWLTLLRKHPVPPLLMAAGFLLTFAPLLYVHITDARINTRAHSSWVWDRGEPAIGAAAKVAGRYLPHFSPGFLFLQGANDAAQKPPHGFGQLQWYLLPLLLAGAIAFTSRDCEGAAFVQAKPLPHGRGSFRLSWRTSPSTRVLAAAVLLYPAGDLLIRDDNGPNALRSLPGAWALILLAAAGAVWLWDVLVTRPRILRWSAAGVLACAAIALHGVHLVRFYTSFNDDPMVWARRNVDLQQACAWLRGQFDDVDMVVCEGGQGFLYAPTLVFLRYDPESWLTGPRDRGHVTHPEFERMNLCLRFGKVHMLMHWSLIRPAMQQELPRHRLSRIIFILRPDDLPTFGDKPPTRVMTIHGPDGRESLIVYDYLMAM